MLLSEKKSGEVKGRCVYNGKRTRDWLSKENSTSPTAATESIFLTAVIDAKEQQDTMPSDIPNSFIQALVPKDKQDGKERIIMKITGALANALLDIAPEVHGPYVVYENGRKVIYV